MKIRLAAYLFLATAPLWARSHGHPAKQENTSDPGYVYALTAANRFLHAWQMGDMESGMVLLGDRVRRSQNAHRLEQFFSNATGRAFEIERGRGHHGRYSFPGRVRHRWRTPRHTQVVRNNPGRRWQERLGGG